MDKWTYRYCVTRDLMLFGIAIEALTLYPHSPIVFVCAVPAGLYSLFHFVRFVADTK